MNIAGGPAGTPMDGQWSSADGIFVATFRGGQFTSTDARTGAVLAQGTYTMSGGAANLNWISTQRKQQFSAVCTFRDPNAVHCEQPGATGFDLRRTA
jgi:hypothetical protein